MPPGVDLLVVDSGSTSSATRDAAINAGVRYVRSDIPGLSIARNAGLAATDRELVVFTDDDCAVTSGFLAPLIAPFAMPSVAAATGTLRDIGDTSAPSAAPVEILRRTNQGLDAGHGALMAFRRSALLASGAFDPLLGAGRHFGGAEDMDAFCRLLHAGPRGGPGAGIRRHARLHPHRRATTSPSTRTTAGGSGRCARGGCARIAAPDWL